MSPLQQAIEALEAAEHALRRRTGHTKVAAALAELRRWEETDVGVSCEYGMGETYRRCYSKSSDSRKGLVPAVLLVRKEEE